MYEQLTKNERLDKVVEMIDALRSEVVGIKNDLASTSTETVEDVIVEHEGLKLKRVDREAREGDYVRANGQSNTDGTTWKDGVIYGPVKGYGCATVNVQPKGLVRLIEVYRDVHNRTPSTVEVFEVVEESNIVQAEQLPFPSIELTANQKRAKLIEKAKKFVEDHAVTSHIVEFIVNRKKRTVVVLIKEYETGKVVDKSIAKCAPGDVFNQWIGKAIALAKAIEIGVPNEFFEAVQPDEIVVGQIVSNNVSPADFYRVTSALMGRTDAFNLKMLETNGDGYWEYARNLIILDDTDAQYEVV